MKKRKVFQGNASSIGHQLDELGVEVKQGFQKLQVDFNQMKISIVEE